MKEDFISTPETKFP